MKIRNYLLFLVCIICLFITNVYATKLMVRDSSNRDRLYDNIPYHPTEFTYIANTKTIYFNYAEFKKDEETNSYNIQQKIHYRVELFCTSNDLSSTTCADNISFSFLLFGVSSNDSTSSISKPKYLDYCNIKSTYKENYFDIDISCDFLYSDSYRYYSIIFQSSSPINGYIKNVYDYSVEQEEQPEEPTITTIDDLLYLPSIDYTCISVIDNNTIRAYNNTPVLNSSINYIDYYPNSHYITKTGVQTFGSEDILPTCISQDNLTTDYLYRLDLKDILVTTLIILIFILFPFYAIITRLFKRWKL